MKLKQWDSPLATFLKNKYLNSICAQKAYSSIANQTNKKIFDFSFVFQCMKGIKTEEVKLL